MSNSVARARVPRGTREEREIRRLAASRTAPKGVAQRARIVVLSWGGANVGTIAEETGLHVTTVRQWLRRFNLIGAEGLTERPRPGRPRVLGTAQREWLVRTAAEPKTGGGRWTLDALVIAAAEVGIQISRSQLRRILLASGVAWHAARGASRDHRIDESQGESGEGVAGRSVAAN